MRVTDGVPYLNFPELQYLLRLYADRHGKKTKDSRTPQFEAERKRIRQAIAQLEDSGQPDIYFYPMAKDYALLVRWVRGAIFH